MLPDLRDVASLTGVNFADEVASPSAKHHPGPSNVSQLASQSPQIFDWAVSHLNSLLLGMLWSSQPLSLLSVLRVTTSKWKDACCSRSFLLVYCAILSHYCGRRLKARAFVLFFFFLKDWYF